MRTRLLLLMLVLCTTILSAQQQSKAFAVTGTNGALLWENFSEIDLGHAKTIAPLYNRTAGNFSLINAQTKKAVPARVSMVNGTKVTLQQEPTSTMVAAAAYDEKQGKLFFSPMRINELRWIDLNDKSDPVKVYTWTTAPLINADVNETANQITRMCMGADGYGYAMSNDAMHLIRFSTGDKIILTDLGAVISEKNNLTINNACGGWGGDMVADTEGNLYVISSNHNVFKVNIETRLASFITQLKDIPAEFTTNGAAVDEDGMLILGSANKTDAFFKVNPYNWSATAINNGGNNLNVSDLASPGFLFDTRMKNSTKTITDVYNEKIAAYPNPVSQGVIKINFYQQPKGPYAVQLLDQVGRILLNKKVEVNALNQLETLTADTKIAKGFYMLRVINAENKVILAKKMIIE